MKNLFLILTIAFASCSTTHKIKTESHKTVDSVVNTIKDSTNVSKEVDKIDNFTAKGIDITFDYGNEIIDTGKTGKKDDTVKWKPFYYKTNKEGTSNNGLSNLINKAVSNNGLNGHIPTAIHIHIDSLGDSTIEKIKSDSGAKKEITQAKVKSTEDVKNKDVKRSGAGFGTYVIVGMVILIGLVILVIKYKII